MKKILCIVVFGIATISFVFCTIKINAQSRKPILAKHTDFNMPEMDNVHSTLLQFENSGTTNTLQGSDKSSLDLKLLIPIIDSIYIWQWDSLADTWYLYPSQRTVEIVYDASNNLISFVSEDFNGAAWVKNKKYTYTYNGNNEEVTSITQTWNGTAWVNEYQYTYTYDAFDNKTQELYQNWSGTAWVNNNQDTYTYDAANNKTQDLSQNWSGTAWTNISLYTYTYNIQNIETSEVDKTWNGSVWVNSSRCDFSYDANNNLTSALSANWNGIAWDKTVVITYTYDAGNHETTELFQSWNGSAWVLVSQSIFQYDLNYNLLSVMMQKWGSYSWINTFKESFTYDANDFTQTVALRSWNNTGAYVHLGDSLYYYFHTVVGIQDITTSLQTISVYPNPTSNHLTIECPQISTMEILNIQGQIIFQQQLQHNKTDIDISSLANGVYILKLSNKNMTTVTKILKE